MQALRISPRRRDSYEVITDPDNFSAVREALEKAGIPMVEADITMIPQNWVELYRRGSDQEDAENP